MAEDDDQLHTWETEYERTWEVIKEDEAGSLQASVHDIVHKAKRKHMLEKPINIRLGMMRHLFLVVDMSQAMEDQDLKPSRLLCTLKLLEYFVEEYFDQNPISQLGIIITRKKRAEKITELGGNPKRHVSSLKQLKEKKCEGEPSLQNSLEMASSILKHMPGHASREVIILFGSLTTCDPGDITDTIKTLQGFNIRVSIVGLAAEVRICKKLCHDTKGKYNVALDDHHLKDLLTMHIAPPPATTSTESSLIKMGFPHHQMQQGKEERPSLCMCHLDSKSGPGLGTSGYYCPQCNCKYCELPVECKVCGLTLVSAPHLARSYHHLFPQAAYREINTEELIHPLQRICRGCQSEIKDNTAYQCQKCQKVFCVDCDVFIHETLHSCPGCASDRQTQDLSQPPPVSIDIT